MAVLYRKYRPRTFAEVIGQNHIKITVTNEIATGEVAHAYLFVGPRGTGKTTIARLFARAINCERRMSGQHEPCNECSSCTAILKDRSLDVIEIDAATHTQVDNVRDNIITAVHVPPLQLNGYKVVIIDEIHMLSKHAFNALLKTIEEPPVRVVFILATTDVYKVPETIISRCQRFDFKKIPSVLMVQRLKDMALAEGVRVPDTVLGSIARRSGGFMRDAESFLGQVLTVAEKGSVDEAKASTILPPTHWLSISRLIECIERDDLTGAFTIVHETLKDGLDVDLYMSDIIDYLRQCLLRRTIGPGFQPDLDEATARTVSTIADRFSPTTLRRLIDSFMRHQQQLSLTAIAELPLELALVEVCSNGVQTSARASVSESFSTPVPGVNSSIDDGDIKKLRHSWNEVLDKLKPFNHSLAVFLKVAHPIRVDASTVTIGFRYDFHAQTVNETKNRTRAESELSAILGRQVRIDSVVDGQYTENHKRFNGSTEPEVRDVLDALGGGEVV